MTTNRLNRDFPMLSADDRFAIDDVLQEYVRAMDHGDIEGTIATFTSDGEIHDVTGKAWDARAGGVRGFAEKWLKQPFLLNGQHWLQRVRTIMNPDGSVELLSYWSWVHWEVGKQLPPEVHMLGTYIDRCRRVDGKWLISKKIIGAWHSGTLATDAVGNLRQPTLD